MRTGCMAGKSGECWPGGGVLQILKALNYSFGRELEIDSSASCLPCNLLVPIEGTVK